MTEPGKPYDLRPPYCSQCGRVTLSGIVDGDGFFCSPKCVKEWRDG